MPISSNDFEKSERESGLLLLDFLRSNPRIAYSVDDLVETLASMDRNETKKEVEKMLTLMVNNCPQVALVIVAKTQIWGKTEILISPYKWQL